MHAKIHGNRSANRKFNVDVQHNRDWRKKKKQNS